MIVRPYTDADLNAILELHRRQGLDYELPTLSECPVGCVIEEGGNITHALFLRRTLEGYWLYNPANEWKRQTLARLLVLHKEAEPVAADAGFEDVHAFIPPNVLTPKMELTMFKLGWEKPLWTCYRRSIAPSLVEV